MKQLRKGSESPGEKRNDLPFAEQVQRRVQVRTGSRLALAEEPRRCWGRARLGKKRTRGDSIKVLVLLQADKVSLL